MADCFGPSQMWFLEAKNFLAFYQFPVCSRQMDPGLAPGPSQRTSSW